MNGSRCNDIYGTEYTLKYYPHTVLLRSVGKYIDSVQIATFVLFEHQHESTAWKKVKVLVSNVPLPGIYNSRDNMSTQQANNVEGHTASNESFSTSVMMAAMAC